MMNTFTIFHQYYQQKTKISVKLLSVCCQKRQTEEYAFYMLSYLQFKLHAL